MAQLLVRGLSEETVRLLRARAERHGRSVEAEHRLIIEDAVVVPAPTTAEWASRLRGTFLAELDPTQLRDDETPRAVEWPE